MVVGLDIDIEVQRAIGIYGIYPAIGIYGIYPGYRGDFVTVDRSVYFKGALSRYCATL